MFQKLTPITSEEYKGKLIVFDGVDGSGKSTMLEMLANKLRNEGEDVLVTMQPTPEMRKFHIFKTFIYKPEKRQLVDYRALQLYMLADRMQHFKEIIEPALKEGTYVLSDRYIFTMLATMLARGNQPESWLNELLPSIRMPHATFIMDVDLETCIQRIKERKSFEDSYVEREHLKKSLESYLTIANDFGLKVINSSKLGINQAFSKIEEPIRQMRVREVESGERSSN
ncbi:dTMP kinase [Bacillus sp. 03113]|uniref:dTMP kinase n=1 Tax=Bacillus sp. 03113 TaxID=2578211 RepID=UPI0015E8BA72|nr:dTMP kinase [Bacillus sp. 03113]